MRRIIIFFSLVVVSVAAWADVEIVGGVAYALHDDGTASVASHQALCGGQTEGEIIVPETIIASGGESYTVTAIDNSAYYEEEELTFYTIPKTITAVGDSAFYHCYYLDTFTTYATTPPTAVYSSFANVGMHVDGGDGGELLVPKGTISEYAYVAGWNLFLRINEIPETYDDVGYDGDYIYDVSPADGDSVTVIDRVTISCATGVEVTNLVRTVKVKLYDEDNNEVSRVGSVNTQYDNNGRGVAVSLGLEGIASYSQQPKKAVKTPGAYHLVVPEQYLYFFDADGNRFYNREITLTYYVYAADDSDPTERIVFTPESFSTVSCLDSITTEFDEGFSVSLAVPAPEVVVQDSHGSEVAYVASYDEIDGDDYVVRKIILHLSTPITEAGTYHVMFDSGYFQLGSEMSSAFSLIYVVSPDGDDDDSDPSYDEPNPEPDDPEPEYDSITNPAADAAPSIFYNLAGQRVDGSMRGIVVSKGKKYVVR